MGRLALTVPIKRGERAITAIVVRPPGRRAVLEMVQFRVSGGFTDKATIRFASRLSGVSETVLRLLHPTDFNRLREHLEDLFQKVWSRTIERQAQSKARR